MPTIQADEVDDEDEGQRTLSGWDPKRACVKVVWRGWGGGGVDEERGDDGKAFSYERGTPVPEERGWVLDGAADKMGGLVCGLAACVTLAKVGRTVP